MKVQIIVAGLLMLSLCAARAEEKKGVFEKGQVLSVIAVTTSKEEADAFVKAFKDGPKASHKMEGFLGLAVAENTKVPGSFMVISLWKNEEALQGYVRSKAFGEDHANVNSVKSAKLEPPGRYVIKDN
ncbi:MAG TPA: antibiotic biosynthesis monooxygenase family protein [Planctomycetota bacterium]|nr:antibiotic biosynthesis monooxygenase family protein [Planctomycetota bacterium]